MTLTLARLFGVNCYQDGQVIVVSKLDHPYLTPSGNNTAESLLIAILLKALDSFTDEIRDSNNLPILDSENRPILDDGDVFPYLNIFKWDDTIIRRGELLFIRKTLVVETYEDATI